LVGKTFDVDDGFLKKIRVAEFQPGRTRIVLEVDELSSYDAFLLPDPYRLIIDIHGKQSRASVLAKAHGSEVATVDAEQGAADEVSDAAVSGRKGQQQKSEKEHAIVARAEKQDDDADSGDDETAAKPRSLGKTRAVAKAGDDSRDDARDESSKRSSGVTKTTVAVKGTDRRIPKTIVGPDEDAATPIARAGRNKKRGGAAAPANTKPDDDAADGSVEEAKALPLDPPSTTEAGESSRRANAPAASTGARAGSRKKKPRSAAGEDTADLETREARPTASGGRSLTRALGLKIGKIVIDAGHGGHDVGTIGPNGLQEKDVVLDVARRLGRLLESRLGAQVIYTRRDDTFIPLETRTAIANRARADLFISIHANSSRDEDARGVETYYLNFTSSPEALEVAARENAVSEKSIHELQDLVKKIALKEKIEESREFAGDVQQSLYGGLALNSSGVRNRGVKKAPFIVLIGANMPSILAEISFVSNPTDERKMGTAEHRQRIAESLYRGVSRYAGGLSGVKVASKIEKSEGQ
jgi:N-acetylmuramoyl-L-alanine amidase